MTDSQLIAKALEAREMSYSPYSNFQVGAALLAKDGRVFQGCNIENAAYTPSNCGERTAFFKAVSQGVTEFEAIAIVGGPKGNSAENGTLELCFPCGVCRQVMREFCDIDAFRVITAKSTEDYVVNTLGELLPNSFGPQDLA